MTRDTAERAFVDDRLNGRLFMVFNQNCGTHLYASQEKINPTIVCFSGRLQYCYFPGEGMMHNTFHTGVYCEPVHTNDVYVLLRPSITPFQEL